MNIENKFYLCFILLFVIIFAIAISFYSTREPFVNGSSTVIANSNSSSTSINTGSSKPVTSGSAFASVKNSVNTFSPANIGSSISTYTPPSQSSTGGYAPTVGSGPYDYSTEFEYGSGFQYNTNFDFSYTNNIDLTKPSGVFPGSSSKLYAYDANGNLIEIPYNEVKGMIRYYEPGNYDFTSPNVAPYSESSIFATLLTDKSNVTLYDDDSLNKGICKIYKNNPQALEQKCNSLNKETCSATDCCVLLGGEKCVSGDKTGPTNKTNYSDIFVKDKNYYYYNGDCYGNCI